MFQYYVYQKCGHYFSIKFQAQSDCANQARLISAINRCRVSVFNAEMGEVLQTFDSGLEDKRA